MNVSVTIGAVGSHVRENWLGVALGAGNPLVLAAKRVFSCVVIKLGNRSNGLPSHGGVAVLARKAQASVRAPRDAA